jgi:hypothetical protein
MPAYHPAAAPADERAFLESHLSGLEQELAAVKDRLAELGDEAAEE